MKEIDEWEVLTIWLFLKNSNNIKTRNIEFFFESRIKEFKEKNLSFISIQK